MLTHRKQVQALADIIGGVEPLVSPEQLKYPFDYLYYHIQNFDGKRLNDIDRQLLETAQRSLGQLALSLLKMQTDDEDLQAVIDEIEQARPGYRPSFPKLSAIGDDFTPVEYMWPGWAPEGYLTILAGYGSTGKTYTIIKLAQAVIHGLPAPDGQALRLSNTRNVIHVDGEDFIRGYYHRAKAWGVDLDYITPYLVGDSLIDLTNRAYQDRLVHMVDALQPSLITIDSLSTIHHRGEQNRADVTPVLVFLHRLAQYANCAVVLLHHPRKPLNGTVPRPLTMHDLSGSGQLTIIARSILGIDVVGDDFDSPRRLKVMKNNFTQHPRPIGFKFIPTGDPQVAQMEFGRLDELLPQPDPTEVEICADWLVSKLQEGPQSYAVLKQQARIELGYNETMLQRARKQILGGQIVDTVGKLKKGNKWQLTAEPSGDDEEAQPAGGAAKTQTCADWLVEKLRAGPMPYDTLKRQVEIELGYNESVLQRARKVILDGKVVDTRGPRVKGNQWSLAGWFRDEL